MSVEDTLDDWRGADVASMSAEKQTLSMHVEALEEQLLTLAKGNLVEIDDEGRQVLATEAEPQKKMEAVREAAEGVEVPTQVSVVIAAQVLLPL